MYQQLYDFFSIYFIRNKYKVEDERSVIDVFKLIDLNKEVDKKNILHSMSLVSTLSGLFSGIGIALTLTPVDNIRIRLQAVQNISNLENRTYIYKNSFDCIKDVHSKYGIKGFYVALPFAILRESVASVIYFGSFEYLKNREKVKHHKKNINLFSSFIYGAFAGGINWTITLPIDLIKTKMISDTILPQRQFMGYNDCFMKIYDKDGIKGFYKGFSVVFTRALVVNGVVLTSFDLCRSKFIKH